MRCTITRPPVAGLLSAAQRHTLALADAIAHRAPREQCQDCAETPLGLCVDHTEALDCIEAYQALARYFGLPH
jgi:hypothetical protein